MTDSLTPEEKVKRFVLERLLLAFFNGVKDPGDLQLEAGNVQFPEGIANFYGQKARLVRYEFVGGPTQGEQIVKLLFDDRASGPVDSGSQVEVTRTYRVVDTGSGASIERVR